MKIGEKENNNRCDDNEDRSVFRGMFLGIDFDPLVDEEHTRHCRLHMV